MGTSTIFLTQGNSLRLFADVRRALSLRGETRRVGFYVTDSAHYAGYTASHPEFGSSADILCEWEILYEARRTQPDRARIAELELRYGETLWNAVVADRRLYMGPNAVREQNYATRYSHEELLSILITASDAMERLFDRVRPNLVIGFICVTLGEYLAHLIARHRDITFVDLRPTRIRNYFYGGEDVYEPSAALERLYTRFRATGVPESLLATAREILSVVRQSHAMYEGVIPASGHDVATVDRAEQRNASRRTSRAKTQ